MARTLIGNFKGEKGEPGEPGDKGDRGDQGVSIVSVTQTQTSSSDEGTNEITVALSNGTNGKFYVKNGSKGEKGEQGAEGKAPSYTEIHETVSGTEITLTDSAEAQLQSLKVYGKSTQTQTSGKNKCNVSQYDDSTAIYLRAVRGAVKIESGKKYTISFLDRTVGNSYYIDESLFEETTRINSNGGRVYFVKTAKVTTDGTSQTSILKNAKNQDNAPQISDFMVEEGTGMTDYEPYTGGISAPNPDYPQPISDVDNAEVTVRGRNILDYTKVTKTYVTKNGITCTYNAEDNSFTFNGTATANAYFTVDMNVRDGEKCIQFFNKNASKMRISLNDLSGAYYKDEELTVDYKSSISRSIKQFIVYFRFDSSNPSANIVSNFNIKPMVEFGNTYSSYEPYKEPQTATIPYILRGIGNVKDELLVNADGTGKWIQRIGSVDLGTLNWVYQSISGHERFVATSIARIVKGSTDKANAICDKLGIDTASNTYAHTQDNTLSIAQDGNIWCYVSAYTDANTFKSAMNGVNLKFEFVTPIEATLTSEEVAQILTLHTFKPTSIISNDKQAEMEVKYIADTKAYVDNHSGGSGGTQIKTKTYTGNGSTSNTITFDEQPSMILGWTGRGEGYTMSLIPFAWGEEYPCGMYSISGTSQPGLEVNASYSGNSITLSAPNAPSAFNGNGGKYTIMYI